MSTPPIPSIVQKIRLSEVPALIKKLTGVKKSRKTVYNWAYTGRLNYSGEVTILKTEMKAGTKYTTKGWVQKFLADLEK